jgi:hypothetical protein
MISFLKPKGGIYSGLELCLIRVGFCLGSSLHAILVVMKKSEIVVFVA